MYRDELEAAQACVQALEGQHGACRATGVLVPGVGVVAEVVHLVHPHLFLKRNRALCSAARAMFARWVT